MATNILGIGIGIANAIGFNKFKMGDIAPIKPIASYRCYDKTNDDADRDVLTDLTGNGHDIQLYNFEFAESSGYGLYSENYGSYTYAYSRATVTINSSSIHITKVFNTNNTFLYKSFALNEKLEYTIRIKGLSEFGSDLRIGITDFYPITISEDGIYKISLENNGENLGTTNLVGFNINKLGECNIIIEQIPDYQGALVSDGVDDYGLCENFPILTKEKGYTVVALRRWINLTINNGYSSLVTNGIDRLNGAFSLELIGNSEESLNGSNFGSFIGTIYKHYNDTFVNQTSKKYNQYEYNRIGTIEEGSNILKIFRASPYNYYSSIALYALEIYDRDLTDEEIAKVKARMIAEYEEKTGNKYEEETT